MKLCRITYLILAFAGASYSAAYAATEAGTTGAAFLKLDAGARPIALAGAYTALANDLYAMRYNPAGLGAVKSMEVSGMFRKGILDTKTQNIGFVLPMPFYGISGTNSPVMAANLYVSDNGQMDWYATNPDGSALHNGLSRNAGRDIVLSLGIAEKMYTAELGGEKKTLDLEHYFGLAGKLISSKLPNSNGRDVSASAYALDAGYQAKLPELHTSFGVSALNMGQSLKYISEPSPLPFTVRAGAAYDGLGFAGNTLLLTADGLRYWQEQENRLRVGVELSFQQYTSLRAGYKFMEEEGGFTGGIGVKWLEWVVDFGFEMNGALEQVYAFNLTYRFSPRQSPKPRKAEKVILDMKTERGTDYLMRGTVEKENVPVKRKPKPHPQKQMMDDFLLLR